MANIHIDFETYSPLDITKVGAYAYAAHPDARVLIMSYKIEGEENPVKRWIPDVTQEIPFFFEDGKLSEEHTYFAQNAFFERSVFKLILKMDPLHPRQWRDPQARLASFALPLSLAEGAIACKLPTTHLKKPQGKYLIKMLCCPDPKTGKPRDFMDEVTKWRKGIKEGGKKEEKTYAEILQFFARGDCDEHGVVAFIQTMYKFENETHERANPHFSALVKKILSESLYSYCDQDVLVEEAICDVLPPLTPEEQKVWEVDQLINERGVYVDGEGVNAALNIIEIMKERLHERAKEITGDEGFNVASRKQFLEYMEDKGYKLRDATKNYLLSIRSKIDNEDAREILDLKLAASKTSLSKFETLTIAAVGGRVRGNLQYHGATTGRWAGRLAQFQNIPRPIIEDVDTAIEAMKEHGIEFVSLLYGSDRLAEVLLSCIRGMLSAPKNKKLVVADYSQIESRALAWLAGENEKLEAFRKGIDLYKFAASKIYNNKVEDVDKEQRAIGKVSELACGYQGAAGAFLQMAKVYGVVVEKKLAKSIVKKWRAENPKIKQFWQDIENAAINSIKNPGEIFQCGPVKFFYGEIPSGLDFLFCKLPSGRTIKYPFPEIVLAKIDYENDEGEMCSFEKESIEFSGRDAYTGQWTRLRTYGGKLTENVTQAVSSDFLRDGLIYCEDAPGLDTVLHVHDETVTEADEDDNGALERLCEIMCRVPRWAVNMPLEAEGYESKRYRK